LKLDPTESLTNLYASEENLETLSPPHSPQQQFYVSHATPFFTYFDSQLNSSTFYDFGGFFDVGEESLAISDAGQEYLYDHPPVSSKQRIGAREYSQIRLVGKRCRHMPGEACGWYPTSARRLVFERQITNAKPSFLRLRCVEAWQLRAHEVNQWHARLFKKVGPYATELWGNPDGFKGFIHVEVDGGCGEDTYWLDLGIGSKRLSRLLYAKQTKVGGLLFVLCYATGAIVEAAYEPAASIQWCRLGHSAYHRVVEYEFATITSIQSESIVSFWTTELAKDFFGEHDFEILAHISHAHKRGLLRLLQ